MLSSSTLSLCVFCGAKTGANPEFVTAAKYLGKAIAKQDLTLVYGGSCNGTMGVLASAALEQDGKVIGVIAKPILDKEKPQPELTQLIVVDTLQERKEQMIALAGGFIVLPGGGGTLEEFADVFSLVRLGLITKPIGILNIHGYYDSLLQQLQRMVAEDFLSAHILSYLKISSEPDELIRFCIQYSHNQTVSKQSSPSSNTSLNSAVEAGNLTIETTTRLML